MVARPRWFVLFGDGKVTKTGWYQRERAQAVAEGRNRVHRGYLEGHLRRYVAPAVALIHCIPKAGPDG